VILVPFYQHLLDSQGKLVDVLCSFFLNIIKPKFLLANFVYDVYVDSNDKAWIIDFGPFGGKTDPLFFYWKELFSTSSAESSSAEVTSPSDQSISPTFELRLHLSDGFFLPREKMAARFPRDIADFDVSSAEILENLQSTQRMLCLSE